MTPGTHKAHEFRQFLTIGLEKVPFCRNQELYQRTREPNKNRPVLTLSTVDTSLKYLDPVFVSQLSNMELRARLIVEGFIINKQLSRSWNNPNPRDAFFAPACGPDGEFYIGLHDTFTSAPFGFLGVATAN